MRHFLEVDDLSAEELKEVLDLAEIGSPPAALCGQGVALVFEKPSNRTRNATEMAVHQLGGHPIYIRGEEVGIGPRESPEDVVRALSCYHRIVGVRVFDHRILESMAAAGVVPVINLLSDRAHPCQALADLLTLRQRWGSLGGQRIAWVGDGNNVARSLTLACALAGIDVALACPPGHGLDAAAVESARARGVSVQETADPAQAARGADAVCTDVWVSMGQEDEAAEREDAFSGFCVDEELMALAKPGAPFLHCLPAHRGKEVATDVIDGPQSAVWQQAENRMHSARGLLLWLVST
jgi:ornithine carbamoyltransferase